MEAFSNEDQRNQSCEDVFCEASYILQHPAPIDCHNQDAKEKYPKSGIESNFHEIESQRLTGLKMLFRDFSSWCVPTVYKLASKIKTGPVADMISNG